MVGALEAVTFRTTIDDPKRFRTVSAGDKSPPSGG